MKVTITPGQRVRTIGNYSEIMCHFRLAGRPVEVELLRREYGDGYICHSAQVYKDGEPFSGPITCGEAGIRQEGDKFFVEAEDGPGDEDPEKLIRETNDMLRKAFSGANVTTITNLGL